MKNSKNYGYFNPKYSQIWEKKTITKFKPKKTIQFIYNF